MQSALAFWFDSPIFRSVCSQPGQPVNWEHIKNDEHSFDSSINGYQTATEKKDEKQPNLGDPDRAN